MKKNIYFLAVIFIFTITNSNISYAQTLTPRFKMPLFFEDAVGNKDTIWVGADPAGGNESLNPAFGEVPLNTPFDSSFEVRAGHGFESELNSLTKTSISRSETPLPNCAFGGLINIVLHAPHLPIKISWSDSSLTSTDGCPIEPILSPDKNLFLIEGDDWWAFTKFYCLRGTNNSQIIDDFSYTLQDTFRWWRPFFPVVGQGIKKLYQYQFVIGRVHDCQFFLSLGNKDVAQQNAVSVYPNPIAGDWLNIKTEKPEQVRSAALFDVVGRSLKQYDFSVPEATLRLPAADLPVGLSFLTITDRNGQSQTLKIVKEK